MNIMKCILETNIKIVTHKEKRLTLQHIQIKMKCTKVKITFNHFIINRVKLIQRNVRLIKVIVILYLPTQSHFEVPHMEQRTLNKTQTNMRVTAWSTKIIN